jgi:hypothetical protein
MVKINQGLSDFMEPDEGEQYQIIAVSETISKGFKGLTIEFVPKKQTEETKKIRYRITAWLGQNDTVGTRSKLGSFISAFTDYFESKNLDSTDGYIVENATKEALVDAQDTDKWTAHLVKFVSWRAKNREIKVIS